MAARGKQPQQHASRGRMLFEQREKRGPRTDRGDERAEIHQRQIRIGQAADLVEQLGPSVSSNSRRRGLAGACGLPRASISRLVALSFGCAKPSSRSPRSAVSSALVRSPAARHAVCSDFGNFGLAFLLAAGEHFAELPCYKFAMFPQRGTQPRRAPARFCRYASARPVAACPHRRAGAYGFADRKRAGVCVRCRAGTDRRLPIVARERRADSRALRADRSRRGSSRCGCVDRVRRKST